MTALSWTLLSIVMSLITKYKIKAEISTDPELTYIGNYQYMKLKNNRTNNTAPSDGGRKTMRTLARLKINTNKVLEKKMGRKFLLSEMFSVLMWDTVHGVIKKMNYMSDGDKTHLKRGTATLLRVSIKFAWDSLISFYIIYRPAIQSFLPKGFPSNLVTPLLLPGLPRTHLALCFEILVWLKSIWQFSH